MACHVGGTQANGALPTDAKLLSDDTVAFALYGGGGFGSNPSFAYEIVTLAGGFVGRVSTVGVATDFHDLQETGDGNYLLLAYRPRENVDLSAYGGPPDALVLDAEFQELTPEGELVWSWNSKDHIDLEETGRWWPSVLTNTTALSDGRRAYDIVHANAMEPDGDSLLVSMRHTDGVYRIDRADGHVEWKLGGTETPESLQVSGDSYPEPLGAQHDARVYSDGTVTVHDNGTGLDRPPRAVRFAVDPQAGTASLVESVADPDVPASGCCGSARKLDGGNWLMQWGGQNPIAEYSSDGTRLSRLQFNLFSYRAYPVEPGRISATDLRQAMDAMYPR